MTTARTDIFSSIRRSLAVKGDERTRLQIVAERLDRAPKGVIPARGQVSGEALIDVTLPSAATSGTSPRLCSMLASGSFWARRATA